MAVLEIASFEARMQACDCGECKSCKMRRAWAEGRFANRKRGVPWDGWSRDEYRFLAERAGTVPTPALAAEITRQFGVHRTPEAIRIKAVRRGVSLWVKGMSMRDVEGLFGLGHRAIVKWWVKPGLMAATRWDGRGPYRGWWFEPADVEAFIRNSPWAYDWRRMRPGHRLTAIAEVVNRIDPWLPYADLAWYVGITSHNLDRWRKRGLVPHKFRPKSGPGCGYVMVRARDFRAIRDAIRAAQRNARHYRVTEAAGQPGTGARLGEYMCGRIPVKRRQQQKAPGGPAGRVAGEG